MKLTQIELQFRDIPDRKRGPQVERTPELYAAIDKKFGRTGSRTGLQTFLDRGEYLTYGSKRICLEYPETWVTVCEGYVRVRKTKPSQQGDIITTTYFEVKP